MTTMSESNCVHYTLLDTNIILMTNRLVVIGLCKDGSDTINLRGMFFKPLFKPKRSIWHTLKTF